MGVVFLRDRPTAITSRGDEGGTTASDDATRNVALVTPRRVAFRFAASTASREMSVPMISSDGRARAIASATVPAPAPGQATVTTLNAKLSAATSWADRLAAHLFGDALAVAVCIVLLHVALYILR